MLDRLLRHRSGPSDVDPSPSSVGPIGKGQPTRSRRQALQQRRAQQVNRVSNQSGDIVRRQKRREREQRQIDLAAGKERAMGARDRGPVRGFTRRYVDSRRSPGELLLVGSLMVLGLGFTRVSPLTHTLSLVGIFLLLAVTVIDCWGLSRRLRRELAQRFPQQDRRGAVLYALMRSTQMRRMRFPPPVGDAPQWKLPRLPLLRRRGKGSTPAAPADT